MEASQLTNNQKIFAFADDVDITSERTLGVLTKCDIVNLEQTDDFEAVRSCHLDIFLDCF
jgi:hypothetical protein